MFLDTIVEWNVSHIASKLHCLEVDPILPDLQKSHEAQTINVRCFGIALAGIKVNHSESRTAASCHVLSDEYLKRLSCEWLQTEFQEISI